MMVPMSPTSMSRFWESTENIWLTKVALTIGDKVLKEFSNIDEQVDMKREGFAQEILEHQYLEEWQLCLGLSSSHFILDTFNTNLMSKNKDNADDNKTILSRIRANEKDNNIYINVQDLQYDWPMEQGVQKSALALDVVDMDL